MNLSAVAIIQLLLGKTIIFFCGQSSTPLHLILRNFPYDVIKSHPCIFFKPDGMKVVFLPMRLGSFCYFCYVEHFAAMTFLLHETVYSVVMN